MLLMKSTNYIKPCSSPSLWEGVRGRAFLSLILLLSWTTQLAAQDISTVAGDGTPGSSDGDNATSAQINAPTGIAVDSNGNLYIADTQNQRIRRVDTTGKIEAIAGTGDPSAAGDEGLATLANLNIPSDVILDNTGNIYIADTSNHRIRKIDAQTAIITTIAGEGTPSFAGDNGPAINANINGPKAIAIDNSTGNLYIADTSNNVIRKVDTDGNISTIAGDTNAEFGGDEGPATAAQLNQPSGIALDNNDNLYIADTGNHRIRKIANISDADPNNHIITTIAGSTSNGSGGDNGPATDAQLNSPRGIAIDSADNLYIADTGNHWIRKIDTDGNITTIAGTTSSGSGGDNGPATQAQLNSPSDIALDSAGNLYIADTDNHRIRKITPAAPAEPEELTEPQGDIPVIDTEIDGIDDINDLQQVNALAISPDGQHLYVTSFSDNAVTVFNVDPNGGKLTFASVITNSQINNRGLNGPNAIAVSPNGKHVYVGSISDDSIVVFTREASTGQLTLVEVKQDGVEGSGDGLSGPSHIAISSDNRRLYVTGTRDNAVSVFDRNEDTGTLTFLTLQQDDINNVDGLATATGVAVSFDNRFIYVAGKDDDAIAVFTRDPEQGEIAYLDNYQNGGEQNITGLSGAYSITISPDNNHLYVASELNNAIVAFERNINTGALTYLATYQDGINGINGLGGVRDLAISPDGTRLYAASINDNALAVFNRTLDGFLTFNQAVQNNTNGITTFDGLMAVTTSPDSKGSFIYTGAIFSNAVTALSTIATDIAVTVTANSQAAINETQTYTITVTNNGPDPASGISIVNSLSAGAQFSTVEPPDICVANNNQITCTLAETLAKDGTASFNLTVTTPGTVSTLTNRITATAAQIDPDVTNNTIQVETQIVESLPEADLGLAITAEPQTVLIDSDLVYTVTITNLGPDPATGVVLTNTLSNGLVYNAEAQNIDNRCTPSVGDATTITCLLENLGVQGSNAFTIPVTTPSTPGSVTMNATVNSAIPDPVSENNTITSQPVTVGDVQVDLVLVDAVATPNTVTVGSDFTYRITINNSSQATARDVSLTANLSSEVTYISSPFDCQYEPPNVTCNMGDLASGNRIVNMTLRATEKIDTFSHTFSVAIGTGTELDNTNNSKQVSFGMDGQQADLVVTIDDGGQAVLIGNPMTYTITVSNSGPDEGNATLSVTLQGPNLAIGAITGDGCGSGADFECSLGAISSGQSKEVTIEATPTSVENLNLTATVTGNVYDPNIPNIAEQETAVSNKTSNLSITSTANPNPALKDKEVTYTTVVTNSGPHEALGVTVTQELPPNVTFVSAESSQGNCTLAENENIVTCLLGPIKVLTGTPSTSTDSSLRQGDSTGSPLPVGEGQGEGNDSTTDQDTGTGTDSGSPVEAGQGDGTEAGQSDGNTTSPLPVGEGQGEGTTTLLEGQVSINIVVKPTTVGQLSSTVTVSSDTFEPIVTDNTVTVDVEVGQVTADLLVTIEDVPDPVVVNNPFTYTITVTNNGPDVATDIEITNQLPDNVIFKAPAKINPSGMPGNCDDVNEKSEIVCTIDALSNGATTTITLPMQTTAVGDLTMTSTVALNEFDPDGFNEDGSPKAMVVDTRVNNPSALFFVEAQTNNLDGVQGLESARDLTVSPDGEHLYVTSFGDNALVTFRRNTSSGQLTFSQALFDGTNDVDGLSQATGITVSPDGSFVYATGAGENAVAVFSRDLISGALTFIEVHKNGTADIEGLAGATAIVATNQEVYVAGSGDDAITIFDRDVTTGQLTLREIIRLPCQPDLTELCEQRLDGINALALTPENDYLLATSVQNHSLSVFSRNIENGNLTLIQTLMDGMPGISGLNRANSVVVSQDGQHVYTTASGNHTLAFFNRASDTGLLSLMDVYQDDEKGIDGLGGVTDVAISPDGRYVYASGSGDNAIAAFRRDADTGELTFIDLLYDNIDNIDGLAQARAITVSPQGQYIYVASFGDDGVSVFTVATAELSVVMTENQDPVQINEQLIYTITVNNNGPHQATGITLEDTLPENINLISFSPSQGTCTATEDNQNLSCSLGTLDSGAKITISLVVSPLAAGELTNTATVSANEFDPTSPTTTTQTTQAVAEADLSLNISVTPDPAQVLEALTYQTNITNNGPHKADNVIVTGQLPETVKFVSAQTKLGTQITPCFFDETEQTITCNIESLLVGISATISLVVTPNTEGAILTHTSSVTADTFDADLSNNSQTKTVTATFQIVADTVNNAGLNIHNYQVAFTGAIIGGSVSGIINNEGLLSDVWILPNTTVSGGKLSKEITNEGVIENVQLLSNTVINGGIVRGNVFGFPDAPATINANIAANTELSNVIIGANSQLAPTAILGEGVVFLDNQQIPSELDLTGALPSIIELTTGNQIVDLSSDVIAGPSLLEQINAIPALIQDQLEFAQVPETGNLWVSISDENMVLVPVSVTQVALSETPSMTIHTDGSVTFITEIGRKIVAQPATENLSALQAGLDSLGLTQFEVANNGNITLFGDEQLVMRPDLYTGLAEDFFKPLGLEQAPSALIEGITVFLLTYMDADNKRREQFFYPVSANPEELLSALQGYPGATSVELDNSGKVSVKIGTRTFSALLDYEINPGSVSTITQFLIIPDKNGDNSEDVRIIYANGDQQLLYLMPFPETAEEIQGIEEVQDNNYVVSQTIDGDLSLRQDDTLMVMKTTETTQLAEDTPPGMTIFPDGSVEFITDTAIKIKAQPVVQDLVDFNAALLSLGLSPANIEGNGNLTVTVDNSFHYSARPDLASTVAAVAMPLGLHQIPTNLPGVIAVMLVFRDDAGNKRQQVIYPTSRYPQALETFLNNMPGTTSVIFNNNGRLSVESDGITYRGIFDYSLTAESLATGGIQLTPLSDVNGDGINDFAVIYGSGEKQIIYQLPQ
jgi:trimeric autotransporter adhesin